MPFLKGWYMSTANVLSQVEELERLAQASSNIASRFMPPDECLKSLRRKRDMSADYKVKSAKSLRLAWNPKGVRGDTRAEFSIQPDGWKDPLPLTENGLRVACKHQLKVGYEWFRQFSNTQKKFIDDFNDAVDHKGAGVSFRVAEYGARQEVIGMFPTKMNLIPEFDIIDSILPRLQEVHGNSMGIHLIENEKCGEIEMRMVFGDPLLVEDDRNPNKKMYPMLALSSNDFGLKPTICGLGMFRLSCLNGQGRMDWTDNVAKWKPGNDYPAFLKRVNRLIQFSPRFCSFSKELMERLFHAPLKLEAESILHLLDEKTLIRHDHAEMANMVLGASSVETEYDFLNLLTDSAKALGTIHNRKAGEQRALAIAQQPGAFSGTAIGGFDKLADRQMLKSMKKHQLAEIAATN